MRDANRAGAVLLTTPKDMARLSPAQGDGIAVAGVTLAWEDEAALAMLLDGLLGQVEA
jgi:tetraacyldisaccharide-1-P 4'-kinase